jgi:hypothetical protein
MILALDTPRDLALPAYVVSFGMFLLPRHNSTLHGLALNEQYTSWIISMNPY